MILTVVLISGAILSATAISALLVLYQLRQVSDVKSSTQAIFAADAGIECVLFKTVSEATDYENCTGTLDNGASYTVVPNDSGTGYKSVGRSGRAARALDISF